MMKGKLMKRLIVILSCIVLMFLNLTALGGGIDISKLSNEELKSLYQEISLKLFGNNLVNGIEIPAGLYEGGVDIPVGSYVITLYGKDASARIKVLEWIDGEERSIFTEVINNTEETQSHLKISINKGNLLSIEASSTESINIKAFASLLGS